MNDPAFLAAEAAWLEPPWESPNGCDETDGCECPDHEEKLERQYDAREDEIRGAR